ncbi:aldo/keto reductase [Polyangium sorediatum]|uniref:Aldo/keto reductase n=1 Tax=Polyangium sorediatum TaxID=889274 RepID=A0ABT6NI50_9BACT|nr:aldo/keto reductase [Polyangium sorediatum]MDI1427989.1 aldo/keto reductase [Polyangium sorediatum]
MEYRTLGNSGVKVSTLCLGAMTFGEADEKSFMHKVGCDEPTAHAILSRALDRGVNFIDTADVYGQDGLSERVIGNWLVQGKHRERTVLATKFRFRMGDGPNGTGASRYRIMRCVEDSLRRLRTDRIDLYQIHMQDNDTPEEETLRALDDIVRQGKVLYIGASNYAAYRLTDSLWTSRTSHVSSFVSLQMQYSLVSRELEREHVPLCKKFGLGILPWSPLAGGFLTGKYQKNQPSPEGTRLDKWKSQLAGFDTPRNWRILDAVTAIAKERNSTKAAVSLAWLVQKPAVTSAIFGARSLEQLDACLAGAELALSAEEMKRLDEASAFDPGYPYEMIGRVQQGRW